MTKSVKTTSAKKVKTLAPVATVAPVAQTETFTMKFVQALQARNIEQFSADTVTAINNAKSGSVALNLVMTSEAFSQIANDVIKSARQAKNTDNKSEYIAVKVLVKMIKAIEAIGCGLASPLDPYSRTIGANLVKLGKISNRSNLVCLSKAIKYTETDSVEALKYRYSCSSNTAGTQSSSTRMMLKYLKICDVVKGKQGDVMTLADNDRARAFVELFSERVVSEEHTVKA